MALQVKDSRCVCGEIYYDEDSASWKLKVRARLEESMEARAAFNKIMEVDLSSGTLQAELDGLMAEGLTQVKTSEGIS